MLASLVAGGVPLPPDAGWPAAVVVIGILVLLAGIRELREHFANRNGEP